MPMELLNSGAAFVGGEHGAIRWSLHSELVTMQKGAPQQNECASPGEDCGEFPGDVECVNVDPLRNPLGKAEDERRATPARRRTGRPGRPDLSTRHADQPPA